MTHFSFWILGYEGTPFTYPGVTILTYFLISLFFSPFFLLAHTNTTVFIVKTGYNSTPKPSTDFAPRILLL